MSNETQKITLESPIWTGFWLALGFFLFSCIPIVFFLIFGLFTASKEPVSLDEYSCGSRYEEE